jgi:hypothetical protein
MLLRDGTSHVRNVSQPEKRKVAGSTPALATFRRTVPTQVRAVFSCLRWIMALSVSDHS